MPTSPLLTGRVAIVTGANHGIGAAVVRGLAARGADVLVTYLRFSAAQARSHPPGEFDRQREQDASEVCADIAALGRRAVAVEIDLTEPGAAWQLFVDARAGALLMAEYIGRHRARNATWGRIVTMTSGTGGGYPGQVSYGAAKAALISYTLSAASEMARDGQCCLSTRHKHRMDHRRRPRVRRQGPRTPPHRDP
jgi:3-oxoacyl-[acyl-carrier protein] reductase